MAPVVLIRQFAGTRSAEAVALLADAEIASGVGMSRGTVGYSRLAVICSVRQQREQPQMLRITAHTYTTDMIHGHPVGNRTVCRSPRCPMRSSTGVASVTDTPPDLSVTVITFGKFPQPAGVRTAGHIYSVPDTIKYPLRDGKTSQTDLPPRSAGRRHRSSAVHRSHRSRPGCGSRGRR